MSVALKSSGRAFHNLGAKVWKARSPLVLSLVRGTTSGPRLADLSVLLGACAWSRSDRYSGAWPQRALKVVTRTLNWILKLTGSQCKEAKTGVIWHVDGGCWRFLDLFKRALEGGNGVSTLLPLNVQNYSLGYWWPTELTERGKGIYVLVLHQDFEWQYKSWNKCSVSVSQ